MNWLKKLFAGPPTGSTGPGVIRDPSLVPPSLRSLRPRDDVPVVEAKRISTESVREFCDKLQREGERTGNRRMLAQAANIRARLAP